jgi:hypothetical protein
MTLKAQVLVLTDTIKTDNHVAVGGVGSYFGITKLPLN